MAENEIQKWADPAMYLADPVPEGGPRVYLLEATPDPLGSIAAAAALYEGKVIRDKRGVTHAERQKYLGELQKTKIKAPLEFVQFHFLFEGVTRGFTHQLVRQRTATFVQESTRFAVKGDMPVGLPPSLAGTDARYEQGLSSSPDDTFYPDTTEGHWRVEWNEAVGMIKEKYDHLVNSGMPAEDARGLLPTNLLTRVHYSTDLRALLDHAGNRLCTQAQFEWREVFAQMAQAIRQYNPYTSLLAQLKNLNEVDDYAAVNHCAKTDRWQWEAIAALLQPVCYQTGRCQFDASFDRTCSIRDRVNWFAEYNVPSAQWSEGYNLDHKKDARRRSVQPIHPAEWLTDPGAAR